MQLLYKELRVPLDAMILGLENLKIESLKQIEADYSEAITPYFDHLISQMKSFKK